MSHLSLPPRGMMYLGALLMGVAGWSFGVEQRPPQLLADMSLEQLGDIRITSVSRMPEQLSDVAAAVTVVTAQDIRRSGATSVPEALRMVPGLHVARNNASVWAMGSRGFSSANSAKLLVLSDTRSIYTPLVSGVFWDVQDYLMADIERIEVIRGPGATQWGSNAVNGVINIITRRADQTQGALVELTAGNEERLIATGRYGGEAGSGIFYRVFAQHSERDDSYLPGALSSDDWRNDHFGFRADWDATARDTFTLQGDIYDGEIGQLEPAVQVIGRPGPERNLEVDVDGGNLLGRWQRRLRDQGELQLRVYYDRTRRDDPSFTDELDTYDLDFQHRLAGDGRHQLMWGFNYRATENDNRGKGLFAVDPAAARDELFSAFVQDQIELSADLQLTAGTKLEENSFSGFEWQPSLRLAWRVSDERNLWVAVSRAVRVPTRYERDIAVDANVPAPGEPLFRLEGNSGFDPEELVAYEIGYRWQVTPALSLDLALFHNEYDGLSAVELGTPRFDAQRNRVVVPLVAQNSNDGHTRGVEMLMRFAPRRDWRLEMTYAYLDMQIEAGGLDLNRDRFIADATPRHQFALRSSHDWRGFEIDLQYRYLSEVQRLPEMVTGHGPSGYGELDLRIARRLSRSVDVALVGRSLLDGQHAEFGAPGRRGEVERSVYGKISWRF